jgi:hypothetical protein
MKPGDKPLLDQFRLLIFWRTTREGDKPTRSTATAAVEMLHPGFDEMAARPRSHYSS